MAEKKAFERKHFFIDRKLQVRYMVTFLVPMLIMLVFMLFTLYFATQSIITITNRIVREDIETISTTQMQDKTNPAIDDYQKVLDNINSYMRAFGDNTKFRKALITSLLWVFGIGLFIIIVQIAFLTIYISHKLAGPIYRFEKVCQSLIDGNYTEVIRLRKGDEMQHLANMLNDVIKVTRGRLNSLNNAQNEEKKREIVSSLQL